ncbi:MAG: Gfo/Idh/MocA family oxidoreductase [Dysgonamonadaceae bacterium]|jgi:predicted dehydrogenase|nr:Gfo/Idh/MocA family oxidoreductase [Dysgonamonadaceae bacterium]
MSKSMSRRAFLQRGGAAALSLAVVPGMVMGKNISGETPPSDKLNIACAGIGGMGFANLKAVESQNIVGLADVDWKYSKQVFDHFPRAKRYYDYRKMYDEIGKDIDAVIVATADHTHAIIAATAMTLGKHVYVQKPLTHSVYESRLLTKLAAKYRLATQMGNQGASQEGVRQTCSWIWAGEIGEVKKVECYTNRPIWPQGLPRPEKEEKVPSTLNWDLFIGPAPYRPYNSIYHPWNWRGWWDFGTGALGDMACHIMQPVVEALKLKYPVSVQASSTMLLTDCAPNAEIVKYVFPARENMPKLAFPEVEVTWYDGGLLPARPAGLPDGKDLDMSGGGAIFYGTKDTLICGCYGVNPYLLSGRKPVVEEKMRKVTLSHEMDWVRACKESAGNRIETTSDFSKSGPLNEMVVMGVLGVRLQSLNQVLQWDGEKMEFTNIPAAATIQSVKKDGFKIHDGHPTFDKTMSEPVNAREFAKELICHTYREGWSLPAMP